MSGIPDAKKMAQLRSAWTQIVVGRGGDAGDAEAVAVACESGLIQLHAATKMVAGLPGVKLPGIVAALRPASAAPKGEAGDGTTAKSGADADVMDVYLSARRGDPEAAKALEQILEEHRPKPKPEMGEAEATAYMENHLKERREAKAKQAALWGKA